MQQLELKHPKNRFLSIASRAGYCDLEYANCQSSTFSSPQSGPAEEENISLHLSGYMLQVPEEYERNKHHAHTLERMPFRNT